MPVTSVIHVVPQPGGRWEVRLDGSAAISFMDLGLALDAATRIAAPLHSARVVVHELSARKAS